MQKNKTLQKIVLIGPVYPYKGGISHYTGLMYRTLEEKYDTVMMSYKLQYPKFLFKKEQRDYENDSLKIENTQYEINTANPFNWITSVCKIKKMKPDLVIFQWWHPYFSPCYWVMEKLLGKTKKMFVCHNVFPHERFPMDRFLTKMVLKSGDYFITHSGKDTEDLLSIKKTADYAQTVLPTFNMFKVEDMDMARGRELLGIKAEEHVILFFGFVREYKGLKHLLSALPELKEKDEKIKLLVVGDFGDDEPEYQTMIDRLGVRDTLEIHKGYIPDKEVEKYFAASDLVVLPYESATQSGIVQIAYSFEKPVVVTDVGGLPDVVADNLTGYVVPSKSPEALADKIGEFFAYKKADTFKEHIKQEAYKFSWERMRENIENLYKR